MDAVATWALARDVTTQLATSLDRFDQLVMAVLGERFVDQFVTADRPIAPLALANLGRQELSKGGSVLRPRSIRVAHRSTSSSTPASTARRSRSRACCG